MIRALLICICLSTAPVYAQSPLLTDEQIDAIAHQLAKIHRAMMELARIEGATRVIDGDTLEVGEWRVRLSGIDAPESKQTCGDWPCGAAATSHMREIAAGVVECAPEGSDRYGRVIAVCYVNGVDLGGEMVRRGLALAYRRYSDRYVPQENAAREEKAGMWGHTFVAPWVWRSESRQK